MKTIRLTAVVCRLAALVAAAALIWSASIETAAAQSRLFSCPHARVLELTVTGPTSISADPIDNGKPMRMNQDPRNPLRFFNGEYSVTLSQNQGQVLLEIPDWGSATCTFGSVNVPPLIPQRGAAAPNPCGPGFHPVPETDRCDPNPRVNPNPQPQQANNVEGKFPMGGQSLGGIMRSAPSMSSARVMGLTEGSPITLLGRSGTMDGYDWFTIQYKGTTGYQWGGIMCSEQSIRGIYQQCQP